ncbi:MAG: NAD-dependent epimerase/dehydratase family protein, partial [Candidatus Zixiibacteriota bacterium]
MIKSLAGRCLFAALSVSLVTCVALMNVELHAARSDDRQCIVVFGASGKIGGLVVTEALARGHRVVGISRDPDKLTVESDRFSAVKGDVTDIESFRAVVQGADSIVISVVGSGADNLPENSTHAIAAKTAIAALAGLENAPRVIQVGGASTMIGDKEAILAAPLLLAPEGSPLYGVIFGHLDALNTY